MLEGTYLIQMDCVFRNGKAVPGADALLKAFDENQISYVIVTEQSGSDRERIVERMRQAGLRHVHPRNIYTSAFAAVDYLSWRHPDKNKVYPAGGRGIREAMDRSHFIENRRNPDYVLMGMDRDLTYADYNDIVHVLIHGAQLVSVDSRIVQYSDGEADLGNGSVVRMLAYASSTNLLSFGRGSLRMYRACARYMNVNPADLLVVGNDFRKDLMSAIELGCTTFLVNEGKDISDSGITDSLHPDYMVDQLDGIAK